MARGTVDWQRWAAIFVTLFFCGVILFAGVRLLLPVFAPFLPAFALSLLVRPAARAVSEKTRIPKRAAALLLYLLFLLALGALLTFAVRRLVREAGDLLTGLLNDRQKIEAALSSLAELFEKAVSFFGGEDADGSFRNRFYGMGSDLLSGLISSLSARLPALAGKAAEAMPDLLFSALIFIIAGFYFCLDREGVGTSLCRLLPAKIRARLPALRDKTKHLSWKYVRVYLFLMFVTFLALFLGFSILRVKYAFLLALLVAFIDLLPVLGVGTVLLPWAGVLLVQRRFYLAFGLLILYGGVTVLRQLIEPRLIGRSFGLHPLSALFATYAGFKLFGVVGMISAPVAALFVKALLRKTVPQKEQAESSL